ncbi:MAG: right-handed parallel beta-helix repeat-containing protein [Armatimonadota bacterium]
MQYTWPLAVAALFVAGPAAAATYTVSPSGNDSNNGTTAPFRTFLRAEKALRDGDTILLKAGVYDGGAYIEERNITIKGEPGAVIDGSNGSRDDCISVYQSSGIKIEGVKIRNARRFGIFVVLSRGLTVRNCVLENNGRSGLLSGNTSDVLIEDCSAYGSRDEHGIYLSQSGDRLTVRRCKLYNNTKAGLQINAVEEGGYNPGNTDFDSVSKNCLIEANELWGNGKVGGAAINMMGVQNSTISNNLVRENLAGGMALWHGGGGVSFGCKNNQIYHNTIVFRSGVGRFGIQFTEGATGNKLFNNILSCGSGPAMEAAEPIQSNFNCFSSPRGAVNSSNLASWRRASGNDANSIEGDPGFTTGYKLSASSRARDAGTLLLTGDLNGLLRPQGPNPDLGCFEADGVPGGGGSGGGDSGGGNDGGGNNGGSNPGGNPGSATVIYRDSLQNGWSARMRGAKGTLSAQSPVYEGSRSIGLAVKRVDGKLELSGGGVSLAGKSVLKLVMHGGKLGGQQLRVRFITTAGGKSQSLNLRNYGGIPTKDGWVEVSVPIADAGVAGGTLTGIHFFAGQKEPRVYLDRITLE